METKEFILDSLDIMQKELDQAMDGLTQDEVEWRPNFEANSIGFILWHMLLGEDYFVQAMFRQKPDLWASEKWYSKLNMPEEPLPMGGYDATAEQIAAFPVPELKYLLEYGKAVRAQTLTFFQNMDDEKLGEEHETPFGNASIGHLMAMSLCEIAQHIGHIAFLRGLQRGLNK